MYAWYSPPRARNPNECAAQRRLRHRQVELNVDGFTVQIRTSAPLKGDCDFARCLQRLERNGAIRTSAPLKGDCDRRLLPLNVRLRTIIRTSAPLKGDCDFPIQRLSGHLTPFIRTSAPLKGDCDSHPLPHLGLSRLAHPNECAAQRRLRPKALPAIKRMKPQIRTSAPLKGDCDNALIFASVPSSASYPNECAAQRRLRRSIGWDSTKDSVIRTSAPLKGDCDISPSSVTTNSWPTSERVRRSKAIATFTGRSDQSLSFNPNECAAQRRLRRAAKTGSLLMRLTASERVRRSKAIATSHRVRCTRPGGLQSERVRRSKAIATLH